MATVDTNQDLSGKILTFSDLLADGSTISLVIDDRGRLKFSCNKCSVDNFDDVANQSLRKLDYWDTFPDITDPETGKKYYEQNRTILYTGINNGIFTRGQYYRVAKVDNSTYIWKRLVNPTIIPMYPYDTTRTDLTETCVLFPTSCCFYFGTVGSNTNTIEINLDLSALDDYQFYGNNVIVLKLEDAKNLKFICKKNGSDITANVVKGNDNVLPNAIGLYTIRIEVLPDNTVTILPTKLTKEDAQQEAVQAYTYGFRYNYDSPSPAISRIELRTYTDEFGNATEEIKQVNSFSSMPAHDFKRCVVKNGVVQYYLYPTNSLYKEDGRTPADLTGKDGDVCVEIPKTYLRITVPYKPETKDPTFHDGEEYSGVVDYLVSTAPIPDPPRNSNGEFTNCFRLIFNGVHPLFRVGGELELDAEGNYQYETKHVFDKDADGNIINGRFEPTEVLLRKAADKCYAAAFASVRASHYIKDSNNNPATFKTLKASANDITANDMVLLDKPDAVDYPLMGGATTNIPLYAGKAIGVRTNSSNAADSSHAVKITEVTNTEARSIAPYADGDMVGVRLPGIRVIVTSNDNKYPTLIPGGCDLVFGSTIENIINNDNDLRINTTVDNKFAASKSFVREDGEIFTKDYSLECSATAEGEVVTWKLTDGHTTIATGVTGTGENGSSTDFDPSKISWIINDEIGTATVSIATQNKSSKCILAPRNYGNRNTNFNWDKQTIWDDMMMGNPNWALNYRPAVSISRSSFQQMHANCVDDNQATFFNSYLTVDKLRTDLVDYGFTWPNNAASYDFEYDDKVSLIALYASSSTVARWNGVDNLTDGEPNDVMYFIERSHRSTHQADETTVDNTHKYTIFKYTKCASNSYFDISKHYYCYNKKIVYNNGSAVHNPRMIYGAMMYKEGDVYKNTSSGGTWTYYTKNETTGAYAALSNNAKLAKDTIYYVARTATGSETNSAPGTTGDYYQIPIHGGKMLDDVWYTREALAVTDNNFEAHDDSDTTITEYRFIDPYQRYFQLADIGYNPINAFGPVTGSYENTKSAGIEFGDWVCDDKNSIMTNRIWKYHDEKGNSYKVEFDHPSLRWKIYRLESNEWTPIYEARRIDPTQFALQNVTANNSAYAVSRSLTRAATPNSTSVTLGLLPGSATGTSTLVFTYDNALDTPYLSRTWTNFINLLKLQYISSNSTLRFSNRYVFTPDTKFQTDKTYYKLIDNDYVAQSVTVGASIPANTYYEHELVVNKYGSCWVVAKYDGIYEETADTTKVSNKTYWTRTGGGTYENPYVYIKFTENSFVAGTKYYELTAFADTVNEVITSDLDFLVNKFAPYATTHLFQPLNPEYRNKQRLYNPETGETVNTSLVYKVGAVDGAGSTSVSYALALFIDENGNIPEYIGKTFGAVTARECKAYAEGHRVLKVNGTAQTDHALKDAATLATAPTSIQVAFVDITGTSATNMIQSLIFNRASQADFSTENGRVWVNGKFTIEYINEGDTRLLPDGEQVGTEYGGNWVVVCYDGTPVWEDGKIITEIDFVSHAMFYGSWIIVEFEDSNYTIPGHGTTETAGTNPNGNQTIATPLSWTRHGYTLNGVTGIGSAESFEEVGPNNSNQIFTAVEGAKDSDGNDIENNCRTLSFDNICTMLVKRKSKRAYNCNTRLKQYMALMMVIDGGTFDTQSGISTGKSWLSTFNYAKSTFSGRTALLGNATGEVMWDPDVDINIQYSDFADAAQSDPSKRVVAFNWRGFENPFGNIGEYEDGIIPCTRFINGHEVTGYWECIDPNAYSDTMKLYNTYKQNFNYNNTNAVTAVYATYTASPVYTWHAHEFPASGWIRRWDPVTFLPTRAGGTGVGSTTYCCGTLVYGPSSFKIDNYGFGRWPFDIYVIRNMLYAYYLSAYTYNQLGMFQTAFYYETAYNTQGTRLQF